MITVQVLTKKQDGAGHHSTEVTIDFSGMSQEQLLLLARARIVSMWQHRQSYAKDAIPATAFLRAVDFVQPDEVISDEPVNLPKRPDRALEKLLEGMSVAERGQVLRMLEEL